MSGLKVSLIYCILKCYVRVRYLYWKHVFYKIRRVNSSCFNFQYLNIKEHQFPIISLSCF